MAESKDCGCVVAWTIPTSLADRAPARVVYCPLHAAAPALVEALEVSYECGKPRAASLYDEECIDGWRWIHPDGREWCEIGDWDAPPPMHPLARRALAASLGEEEAR